MQTPRARTLCWALIPILLGCASSDPDWVNDECLVDNHNGEVRADVGEQICILLGTRGGFEGFTGFSTYTDGDSAVRVGSFMSGGDSEGCCDLPGASEYELYEVKAAGDTVIHVLSDEGTTVNEIWSLTIRGQ